LGKLGRAPSHNCFWVTYKEF